MRAFTAISVTSANDAVATNFAYSARVASSISTAAGRRFFLASLTLGTVAIRRERLAGPPFDATPDHNLRLTRRSAGHQGRRARLAPCRAAKRHDGARRGRN